MKKTEQWPFFLISFFYRVLLLLVAFKKGANLIWKISVIIAATIMFCMQVYCWYYFGCVLMRRFIDIENNGSLKMIHWHGTIKKPTAHHLKKSCQNNSYEKWLSYRSIWKVKMFYRMQCILNQNHPVPIDQIMIRKTNSL